MTAPQQVMSALVSERMPQPTTEELSETFPTLEELLLRPELLQPPECILPRLAYRGRLAILAGPDKIGKSTFLRHGTARFTRREKFLGESCGGTSGRAIVVGLEEAIGDGVRGLYELDAVPQLVRLVLSAPPDLYRRLDAMLLNWRADLVIIDSLQEFARVTMGSVPDDGDSSGWSSVVRPLVSLARKHDVAFLILHHVRRSDGEYRGSSEIAAAADALFEMTRAPKTDDSRVRCITGRARWPVQSFRVAFRDGQYEMDGGAELSLDARILAHTGSTPGISKTKLRDVVGGRASAVDAAVERLVHRGALVSTSKGFFLPSGQLEMEGS